MDFYEAVQARYSCRKYHDRPVEEEKLMRILEAARLAPSASNRQETRLVVVRNPAVRAALREAAHGQSFVGEAPIVIAGCAETDERVMASGFRADVVDVTIAMEHVALAAAAEGLGTCWIGAFDQQAAKRAIGAPDRVPVIHLMTLGYPADQPRPRSRLPLETIYMRDQYRPTA
jgi:nitroreductase